MRAATLVPHLIAVVGFFLTHGTSAGLAFAARRERDPARLSRLLDLSSSSMSLLYGWAGLLLALGVLNGFRGGFWGSIWIWAALGLLITMVVIMNLLATRFYARVRSALGTDPAETDSILQSSRPFLLAAIGLGAVTLFLWLMVAKPF